MAAYRSPGGAIRIPRTASWIRTGALACALLSAGVSAVAASAPSLFHDGFDALSGAGTARRTTPVSASGAPGPESGAALTGPIDLAPGRTGQCLRLSGRSQAVYAPGTVSVDADGGEIAFWVKLNFDPLVRSEKTRTVLRNQQFVTLWDLGRGHTQVSIYSPGEGGVTAAVVNADRNIVHTVAFKPEWRDGEWHRLALRWGTRMELVWDGRVQASEPVSGLFGAVPVDMDRLTTIVGSHIGYGDVDSEFCIDELDIAGPTRENIAGRPRLMIPRLAGTPVIDGDLRDPCWERAARASGFVKLQRPVLGAVQPALFCWAAPTGICIAVQVAYPDGRAPRAMLKAHDAAIYSEDTVEVFLQPAGSSRIYQFMLSAGGARFDATAENTPPYRADVGGYNPEWQGAARQVPGGWVAEILVPYAALGAAGPPAAGDVWHANVCLDSSGGFSEAVSWAFAGGDYCRPVTFGELVFADRERTLRAQAFDGIGSGRPRLSFRLIGDFQPAMRVRTEIAGPTGLAVYDNTMNLRDTRDVDFAAPGLVSGRYRLSVTGSDETGACTFRQTLGFETARAFDLSVSSFPHAGVIEARVDARGVTGAIGKVAVNLVSDPGGKPVAAREARMTEGAGSVRFDRTALPPGKYTIRAEVLAPDGRVMESASAPVEVYPTPSWAGSTAGIDHTVPPPFVPVRDDGVSAAVWGRRFEFGRRGLPARIRNQGTALLRAPVTLTLRTAEGPASVDLGALPARVTERHADAVVREARADAAPGISLRLRTTVEFDGFVRCDLQLSPAHPVTVSALELRVPLAPGIARLLLTSNGPGATAQVLSGPVRSGFMPYVWVGNDDMGIAWCAETDRYWTPGDAGAITVEPTPAGADLRVRMISKAVALGAGASFSFALMPTPVRPIPQNDPYALPSWSTPDRVTFAEHLEYPDVAMPTPRGTLEFRVRRLRAREASNTCLFRIGTQTEGVALFALTPDKPDRLVLCGYGAVSGTFLEAQAVLPVDRFAAVAVQWAVDGMRLYVDGRLAGSAGADRAAAFAAAIAKPGMRLRFGSHDDWGGCSGIVVDDIRVSPVERYTGDTASAPDAAVVRDASTLIADTLEAGFRPDGQDARTPGGGVPSIGSRFVAGAHGRGVLLDVAPARPGLDVLRAWGIHIDTDWAWQDEMRRFYGQPVLHDRARVVPGLAARIASFHRRGIQLIPYALYPAVSSTSGLIERYGDEWGLRPLSTTPWQMAGAPPGHFFLNCCRNARGYVDYLVSGVEWLLDELGFDGFYSDGLTSVAPCQNEDHGCGYRDERGSLHPTVPLFATREALKRLYRVVKSRNPGKLVINHCSFTTLAPILSFSDVVYTGEHEDYENLATGRVRFASKPWGLFITTLGNSEHDYSPLHTMASLLHGTSIWGSGIVARKDFGRKERAIRETYRQFGTTTAVWAPYHAAHPVARPDAPGVKVSGYYHPGTSALLMIGNFDAQPRDARVQLDLSRLGLAHIALTARNALTLERIPLGAGGSMRARVAGKGFVLAIVERATAPARSPARRVGRNAEHR